MSMFLLMARAKINHGASAAFDPSQLFAARQRGGWWDPSDMTTLFQDAAGGTPVTAVGQRVMLMRDKSGNNNHFTQATASQAPTMQKDANGNFYLSLASASNQFMSAGNGIALAPQASSIMALVAGNPNSAGTAGTFYARAQAAGVVGRYWAQPNAGSSQTNYASNSGVATSSIANASIVPFVMSGAINRAAGIVQTRINAVAGGSTGNFTPELTSIAPTERLLLGAYNDANDVGQQNYLDGCIYGFILVFDAVSASKIASAEKWLGKKCGVSL